MGDPSRRPGIDPSKVEVTFDGGQITFKGEISLPEGTRAEDFWLRENFYGQFSRVLTLPEDAVGEQARAQFVNGMLVLTVPRAQAAKPRSVKIPVNAGSTNSPGPAQLGSSGSPSSRR
jgi:HSP20 family protein